MLRNHGWLTLITLAVIGILGCGKSEGPVQRSTRSPDGNIQSAVNQKADTPEAACREFLEAVRTGNDEKAAQMLSAVAQEKAAALGRSITPSASDTARFAIGKVKYVGEDGAQVESTWTDVDNDGQAHSDSAVWVMRREQQGWRIVGVAATIFQGEPPLVLNFEDPDEVLKKQEWARAEILRRAEKENLQAKEPENSENSMRR
ncbi:MAG: hypothetical protein ABSA77_04325 [Thermoguttaceae bacterium]